MAYKAFISYSHETDEVTAAVQSALHRFAKPWYRLRAVHVFRDQTSLAANPGLAASLESAMHECEYLLLVATPQSAQSVWVKWEIACWLKDHPVERILILLADGDLSWNRERNDFDWDRTTSLPEELKGRFAQEPVYVDLRWTANSPDVLSLKNPRFREAILNLAAPLHNKSKDELDGEDVRQFRRTRSIALAAICAILITIGVAGWQTFLSTQRQKALITAGSNVAQEKKVANSRALAAEANVHLKDDPELSLLLADEAAKSAQTTESEDALRRALTESRLRATLGDSHTPILSAVFSPDGRLLATRDHNERIQIWEAPDWKQKAELPQSEGRVNWVSFSPDSKHLVDAGGDGNPKIWDVSGWKVEAELKGHNGSVQSAEFSPDGRLVATSGHDHTVRLWNAQSGASVAVLEGHTAVVVCALFSPDSKRLITIADEENDEHPTRLWDVSTYKPVAYLEGTIPNFDIPIFTRTSVFSHDGKFVATVADQNVWVWSTDRGRLVKTLKFKPGAGRVWEASFSPTANLLAIADYDGAARIWDFGSKAAVREVRGHTGPVWSAAFSPDGKSLLTSSEDKTAKLWDVNDGTNIDTLTGSGAPLRRASFSGDGRYVVTLGNDTPAKVFGASSPGVVQLHHNGETNAVAFSPDGKLIATASFDRAISIWDANTHRTVRVFGNLSAIALSLAFSRDGRFVAAGCSDASVRLFDLQSQKQPPALDEFEQAVRTVSFSADGKLLMAASQNGLTRIRDLAARRVVAEMDVRESPPDLIYEVAFDPRGRWLARTGQNGIAEILEVPSGKVKATLRGHTAEIQRLRFSSDGRLLVTAGRDHSARVWDVETGKMVSVLRGHTDWVTDADISSDGKMVVTAGQDKTVRVWNTADGRQVAQLRDATGSIWAAAWSPDQTSIVSASADGFARIYPSEMFAPFDTLQALARSRETRKLTAMEVKTYLPADAQH